MGNPAKRKKLKKIEMLTKLQEKKVVEQIAPVVEEKKELPTALVFIEEEKQEQIIFEEKVEVAQEEEQKPVEKFSRKKKPLQEN